MMGMASVWPPPVSCPYFPHAHLHASFLWVCLHGLQCGLSPTALHDDPAVLWLTQSQDAQGCTALLAYLQGGSQG